MSNHRRVPLDAMLPPERTALAWERTAIAIMVAGVAFARFAADALTAAVAFAGIVVVVAGAAMLVWAGLRYDRLGTDLDEQAPVVAPSATRVVGAASVAFIGLSLVVATVAALG